MKFHPVSPEQCFLQHRCKIAESTSLIRGFGSQLLFEMKHVELTAFLKSSVSEICAPRLWGYEVWNLRLSQSLLESIRCCGTAPHYLHPLWPSPSLALWHWIAVVSGGNLPPSTPIQDLTRSPRLLCNVWGPFALIVHPFITASPSIRVLGVLQNVPAKFGRVTLWTARVTQSSQGHVVTGGEWNLEGTHTDSGGLENAAHKFLFEEGKPHGSACKSVGQCVRSRAL